MDRKACGDNRGEKSSSLTGKVVEGWYRGHEHILCSNIDSASSVGDAFMEAFPAKQYPSPLPVHFQFFPESVAWTDPLICSTHWNYPLCHLNPQGKVVFTVHIMGRCYLKKIGNNPKIFYVNKRINTHTRKIRNL